MITLPLLPRAVRGGDGGRARRAARHRQVAALARARPAARRAWGRRPREHRRARAPAARPRRRRSTSRPTPDLRAAVRARLAAAAPLAAAAGWSPRSPCSSSRSPACWRCRRRARRSRTGSASAASSSSSSTACRPARVVGTSSTSASPMSLRDAQDRAAFRIVVPPRRARHAYTCTSASPPRGGVGVVPLRDARGSARMIVSELRATTGRSSRRRSPRRTSSTEIEVNGRPGSGSRARTSSSTRTRRAASAARRPGSPGACCSGAGAACLYRIEGPTDLAAGRRDRRVDQLID